MMAIVRGRRTSSVMLLAAASAMLGACTVMPTGPSVMALPGSSKSVGQYQVDAAECRQYADAVIAASGGGTAAAADNSAASTAAAGSPYTAMSSWQLQRGYDSAFLQCMYARGNRVPTRSYAGGPSRPVYLDRAPPASAAYPPPNTPPPPGVSGGNAPATSTTAPAAGYPPPPNIPPSSYPPPNTPPPVGLPPRGS